MKYVHQCQRLRILSETAGASFECEVMNANLWFIEDFLFGKTCFITNIANRIESYPDCLK